jgi:hypothetical protein
MVKIIWMFLDFKCFSNDTRWVEGDIGHNFGFIKTDEVFRVVRVFDGCLLRDTIVVGVNDMFLKASFEGSSCLTNV